ncbi:MAG: alpha/beta hydrolase [Elusimicrobia bacterium]|nr:alpha/beta hydrolase [Elusimicrobiota bacterium]
MALALALLSNAHGAPTWQPSAGHVQVPIWPAQAPDLQPIPGPEDETGDGGSLVAGSPWVWVTNVLRPTMTVYAPTAKNTGAAVIVFPGGGYQGLAIDLEGTEVCDWLTAKGVTCILLKYRVPYSGPYWDKKNKRRADPKAPTALQDAQRALSLTRHRARELGVDPHKIGVLGFSAGGHLAAAAATESKRRAYKAVDEADKESCRPDFSVPIYPGHLWNGDEDKPFDPSPYIRVDRDASPTFLLQAEDDHVDGVEQALTYYALLKKAKVPVEMHLYAKGGHAFGLRPTKLPITGWPKLVEAWLADLGVLPR